MLSSVYARDLEWEEVQSNTSEIQNSYKLKSVAYRMYLAHHNITSDVLSKIDNIKHISKKFKKELNNPFMFSKQIEELNVAQSYRENKSYADILLLTGFVCYFLIWTYLFHPIIATATMANIIFILGCVYGCGKYISEECFNYLFICQIFFSLPVSINYTLHQVRNVLLSGQTKQDKLNNSYIGFMPPFLWSIMIALLGLTSLSFAITYTVKLIAYVQMLTIFYSFIVCTFWFIPFFVFSQYNFLVLRSKQPNQDITLQRQTQQRQKTESRILTRGLEENEEDMQQIQGQQDQRIRQRQQHSLENLESAFPIQSRQSGKSNIQTKINLRNSYENRESPNQNILRQSQKEASPKMLKKNEGREINYQENEEEMKQFQNIDQDKEADLRELQLQLEQSFSQSQYLQQQQRANKRYLNSQQSNNQNQIIIQKPTQIQGDDSALESNFVESSRINLSFESREGNLSFLNESKIQPEDLDYLNDSFQIYGQNQQPSQQVQMRLSQQNQLAQQQVKVNESQIQSSSRSQISLNLSKIEESQLQSREEEQNQEGKKIRRLPILKARKHKNVKENQEEDQSQIKKQYLKSQIHKLDKIQTPKEGENQSNNPFGQESGQEQQEKRNKKEQQFEESNVNWNE